ncbi:MAG: BPSS1780 family membrane protein [Gemmatimonadota bacterium]
MLIGKVPATAGALWLRDGWRLFARQPLGLSAMVVVYLMMLFVPALVPFIGIAISAVLAPFATFALLAACREVDAKRTPNVGLFVQPFQDARVRTPMFQLGIINAGLVVTVALLGNLFGGSEPAAPPASLQDIPLDAVALQLLLYTPVLMLMWFAPVLVGWHRLTPGKAMFGSVVACWRNKGALLVFGVVVTAMMMATSAVIVGLLAPLMASRQALSLVLAPLALVLMTLVQASFYPMYRSVFQTE